MTRIVLLIQLVWIPVGVLAFAIAKANTSGGETSNDAEALFYFWLILEFPIAVASIIAIAAAVLPGEGHEQ